MWFWFVATWSVVSPFGAGAFGLPTWGAKNLKISELPKKAEAWRGVHPLGPGALGFSTWGALADVARAIFLGCKCWSQS